jgi:hypothetical protein
MSDRDESRREATPGEPDPLESSTPGRAQVPVGGQRRTLSSTTKVTARHRLRFRTPHRLRIDFRDAATERNVSGWQAVVRDVGVSLAPYVGRILLGLAAIIAAS